MSIIEEEKGPSPVIPIHTSPLDLLTPRQLIGGGLDDLQIILKSSVAELFSSKHFDKTKFNETNLHSSKSLDLKSLEKWDLGTLLSFLSTNANSFLGRSSSFWLFSRGNGAILSNQRFLG